MEFITGVGETEHVTSAQHRAIFERVIGPGSYILDAYELLEPELQSSNSIKIRSGMLSHHGGISEVKKNTYDEVTIANGTQGMKRVDLVVARYERNPETEVEKTSWVVIQGEPSEGTPTVPDYVHGNMQDGDTIDDCPLYEVYLNGIQVTEVRKLLKVLNGGLAELNSNLAGLIIKRSASNKVNVSAGAQSYTYITISLPAGYSVLSVSAVAAHSTTLCGTASISGDRVYIPYSATTAQAPETFSAEIVLLKTL